MLFLRGKNTVCSCVCHRDFFSLLNALSFVAKEGKKCLFYEQTRRSISTFCHIVFMVVVVIISRSECVLKTHCSTPHSPIVCLRTVFLMLPFLPFMRCCIAPDSFLWKFSTNENVNVINFVCERARERERLSPTLKCVVNIMQCANKIMGCSCITRIKDSTEHTIHSMTADSHDDHDNNNNNNSLMQMIVHCR